MSYCEIEVMLAPRLPEYYGGPDKKLGVIHRYCFQTCAPGKLEYVGAEAQALGTRAQRQPTNILHNAFQNTNNQQGLQRGLMMTILM